MNLHNRQLAVWLLVWLALAILPALGVFFAGGWNDVSLAGLLPAAENLLKNIFGF